MTSFLCYHCPNAQRLLSSGRRPTTVVDVLRFRCSVKPISQLRFDYDTITIRRYHDAFDYDGSDRSYDLRLIRLRYDYDTTTTKN